MLVISYGKDPGNFTYGFLNSKIVWKFVINEKDNLSNG